jgi:DNA repair protein RecO (recombination protein O)
MQIKDKVFVLKTVRYGEADLIVQALNPLGARLNLFARAALKSKKRFGGGVLEPTHYLQVLYRDKNSASGGPSLHTLQEASILDSFQNLRSDYSRLQTALHIVRLVADITREGDTESADLFNLLGNTLKATETSAQLEYLFIHFQVKLLTQQGVLPHDTHESLIMHAPISAHAELELTDREWKDVARRNERVLNEYLGSQELRK